jgi:uncharacterized protein
VKLQTAPTTSIPKILKILFKNGKVKDMGKASDINLSVLTKTVRKYFACYPKELDIN